MIAAGGAPSYAATDNDTQLTSWAVDIWEDWNDVQLNVNRPGKPFDNAFIEAFNA